MQNSALNASLCWSSGATYQSLVLQTMLCQLDALCLIKYGISYGIDENHHCVAVVPTPRKRQHTSKLTIQQASLRTDIVTASRNTTYKMHVSLFLCSTFFLLVQHFVTYILISITLSVDTNRKILKCISKVSHDTLHSGQKPHKSISPNKIGASI